ncbi:DUF7507 domain-containing protein [Parafrankia irregularis]|uniref:DUF7507 domain-containing protein n=1 Tax=Parafrankia irregularis TaxID=795642 RepID=UPI003BF7C8C9
MGQKLDYSYLVTNIGPVGLSGVRVVDGLPGLSTEARLPGPARCCCGSGSAAGGASCRAGAAPCG